MTYKDQTTVTPNSNKEDDSVGLLFDFEELDSLMSDFKQGFKSTTEISKVKGRSRKGGGFDYIDKVSTVRDYNYYRGNELWQRVAEELDIDMDDDFSDEQLSEMYSFAYDQNDMYENPSDSDSDSDGSAQRDDSTEGVTPYSESVPRMDVSYGNIYPDEDRVIKPAFSGNHFKLNEPMSLNLDEGFEQAGYMMTNSSGLPEDSGFKGNTNSLHD